MSPVGWKKGCEQFPIFLGRIMDWHASILALAVEIVNKHVNAYRATPWEPPRQRIMLELPLAFGTCSCMNPPSLPGIPLRMKTTLLLICNALRGYFRGNPKEQTSSDSAFRD